VHWYTTHTGSFQEWPVGKEIYKSKIPKVIAGIPGCCESHVLTCKHCGGDVLRTSFTDGKPSQMVISDPNKPYRTVYKFQCQKCHRYVMSGDDHWHPNVPRKKSTARLVGFADLSEPPFGVFEALGIGAGNFRGIRKLEVSR
jgi:hypothetical protein